MTEHQESSLYEQQPGLMLLIILISVFLGFVIVGPTIGFLVAAPFFEGDFTDLAKAMQNPSESTGIKLPVYILQGVATFMGLIVTPALVLLALRKSIFDFFRNQQFHVIPLLLVPVIVISFMGVNSWFVQWNAGIHFPDFLKGFENWAREKEEYAAELTQTMTQFDSTNELLIAFLVIAIIPAIGEELVFRGLIQNEFQRVSKNPHVSIWLAAILFSAFHLQFFGFIPRILLGALFGYLYYWSGNISLAILAHFVNNGVAVFALYFHQRGELTFNVEGTEAFPLPAILFSAAFTFTLLYYFRNYFQHSKETTM